MTQRIATGITDQVVYFNAAPGGSSFTVDRSRNNSALTAMTTPTVSDLGDGVYTLLLNEDMTIGASNITEAMAFVVKGAGISTTIIHVELFDDTAFGSSNVNVASIDAGVITATTIAVGAIDAATFAAGAINAAAIASNAIDSNKVAAGTITATTFAAGAIDASALATDAVTEIAQGSWAEVLGTTTLSASALMQIVAGVAAGKISGAASTTVTIRNVEDDENMVVATVDADGNRSAVVVTTPSD